MQASDGKHQMHHRWFVDMPDEYDSIQKTLGHTSLLDLQDLACMVCCKYGHRSEGSPQMQSTHV